MWCLGKTEKITWTDRMRNEEVLNIIKEEGNVLHTLKRNENFHIKFNGFLTMHHSVDLNLSPT
jgi:hypothetical protein